MKKEKIFVIKNMDTINKEEYFREDAECWREFYGSKKYESINNAESDIVKYELKNITIIEVIKFIK